MFLQNMREAQTSTVTISDFSKEVVEAFVHFLYTDSVSTALPQESKDELYQMAHRFELEGLVEVCGKQLFCDVSAETCVEALKFAYVFGEEGVFRKAATCMSRNKELLATLEWKELCHQYPDLPTATMQRM